MTKSPDVSCLCDVDITPAACSETAMQAFIIALENVRFLPGILQNLNHVQQLRRNLMSVSLVQTYQLHFVGKRWKSCRNFLYIYMCVCGFKTQGLISVNTTV